MNKVDKGTFSMDNGSYSMKTNVPDSTSTLMGDANNFYMDVDTENHGLHKFIGTYEKYIYGHKLTDKCIWDQEIEKRAGQPAEIQPVKDDISELKKHL